MPAPDYRVEGVTVTRDDGTATITFTVSAAHKFFPVDLSAFDLIEGARHAIGGSTTVVVHNDVTIDGREVARAVSDVISSERASG